MRSGTLTCLQLQKIAFKAINSSTIILPAWWRLLEEIKMKDWIMPHDASMCWNLTYDMLKFALEYHKAVDMLTADRQNELHDYKLSKREWTIANQLCDVLKASDVSNPWNAESLSHYITCTGLEGCYAILLMFNAQPCYSYSCHGLYQWQAYCPCPWLILFPSHQSLTQTQEEDTEPVLLAHRFVGGVLHRHGYVTHILICKPFLFLVNQFYTHIISSCTSKQLPGNKNGSKWWRSWYMTHLNNLINREMLTIKMNPLWTCQLPEQRYEGSNFQWNLV